MIAKFTNPTSQTSQASSIGLTIKLLVPGIPGAIEQPPPDNNDQPQEIDTPEPASKTDVVVTKGSSRMDEVNALPVPGIVYYPTSFLTQRPQPLTEANLDPPQIRPIVASGKVILTVWINPFGKTAKVAVEKSDLPQYFVDVAVVAFQQLLFKPGELHGQKVGTVMKIEITYDDGRMLKSEVIQ